MEVVKQIQNKLKVLFSSALTEDEKAVLKQYHDNLAAQARLEEVKPQFAGMKTKEGKEIKVGGEMVAGSPVTELTAEGVEAPVADGSYELEDGTMITVVGGVITEVKKKEEMPAPVDMNQAVQRFELKFSEHEKVSKEVIEAKFAAEKAELKAEIAELKKVQLSTLSALQKLMEVPVDTIPLGVEEKKWEDLTPIERYRLSKQA